jgi:type I restriction enzyme, S subunit
MNVDIRPELPHGWRWARLGEVCEINPPRPSGLQRSDDAPTTFVPMSAVDERLGMITRSEVRPFSEVRRGYTHFAEGDILFAKITPCMQNGKHAIANTLIGGYGFGTTEFHVIHSGPEVTPDWIHHFLRQPSVLEAATAHFSGTVGQRRVPEDFLFALALPLPPVIEQRRIAAILKEQMATVERARVAAEAQLEAAKALSAAYLRAVFNSPEAQQWPKRRLREVGDIVSGVTLGRKVVDLKTRKVPYLRVANVKDGHLDLADVYEIEATEAEIVKWRLKSGDLLLTEGGDPDKLGRGTFWEEQIPECIHQNHIFRVRFRVGELLPQFVSVQIGSQYGKSYFLAHAKQTTGIATINQQVLGNFPLMVPPLAKQQHVAVMLSEQKRISESFRQTIQAQLDAINKLPAALLRRAFRGELGGRDYPVLTSVERSN